MNVKSSSSRILFHLVLSSSAVRFVTDCSKELTQYQLDKLREVPHTRRGSHGELVVISVTDTSVIGTESWLIFKRIFEAITEQLPEEEFSFITNGVETGTLFTILENEASTLTK